MFHVNASRLAHGRAALVALLVVLCFALFVAPVAAAGSEEAAVRAAPCPVVVAFLNDILGNRARMIQVGCVFVAVGIFVLRMSYR